jgi:hypothetical protein
MPVQKKQHKERSDKGKKRSPRKLATADAAPPHHLLPLPSYHLYLPPLNVFPWWSHNFPCSDWHPSCPSALCHTLSAPWTIHTFLTAIVFAPPNGLVLTIFFCLPASNTYGIEYMCFVVHTVLISLCLSLKPKQF